MKSGYVYVISTDLYKEKDIYKIGFTENLERRLKQFNNTRTHDDQYYIVNCWKTVHYTILETRIHQTLTNHHLKNELFQCPLDKINKVVREIFEKNSFFNHYDLIIESVEQHKVKWHASYNYFSITSGDIEIMMNDKRIVDEVRKWISVNDKYNLYQFICPSYFVGLVTFLKERCAIKDVEEVDQLTSGMTNMTLENADALDDVNINALTIEE